MKLRRTISVNYTLLRNDKYREYASIGDMQTRLDSFSMACKKVRDKCRRCEKNVVFCGHVRRSCKSRDFCHVVIMLLKTSLSISFFLSKRYVFKNIYINVHICIYILP
ncbi:hypothetical protein PUN28_007484 [Cardiocondyla obscurior]|uniref:Uncharacterized protein n=1 Tax=Cardiocondyla obscurior TaxID=286306 RepID=A0AAW2G5T9_9HYME